MIVNENIKTALNFVASIGLSITGYSIPQLQTATIPVIVMQTFQILAWSGSAIIGGITLIKYLKQKKHESKI